MIHSSAIRLMDRSNVGEVRRASAEHARRLGWSEDDQGDAEIIATELATNLVKHARDGVIAISSHHDADNAVVRLIAVDHGPGMTDPQRCLKDGFSTAGSPGTGLGAVYRLAEHADVVSSPDGTVIVAEMRRRASDAGGSTQAPIPHVLGVAGFAVPKEGETRNGDGWAYRRFGDALAVIVCDGLGHGPHASDAAKLATATFLETRWDSPKEAIANVHAALQSTRGAAAAVAVVDAAAATVRFCGIGNISASIVDDGKTHHLVSQNGIVGSSAVRIMQFDYAWSAHSTLLMHSDGITARWQPDRWPGLWRRHPGLIAGVVYRDCARGTDDAIAIAVTTR